MFSHIEFFFPDLFRSLRVEREGETPNSDLWRIAAEGKKDPSLKNF